MTMIIYRAKKSAYGGENTYPAIHRVGCDFDKETVKVSGVKWASF